MLEQLKQFFPADGVGLVLTLFLSFLVGLEREEHRTGAPHYVFGGVRTFPLIGLIGFALGVLSGQSLMPVTAGFAVVGAFLWLSYQHKLGQSDLAGVTTEVSALATYVIGALVARDLLWLATALAVISLLLLEMKGALETLSQRIPTDEIFTFTKFLLLTAVILPVVPNESFGPFSVNPFKTWLVVVAVSTISYASYILQLKQHGHGGVLLAAILGGLYSSTMTTVVLAKQAREQQRPHLFSGAILISSSVMYLRILPLVGVFNIALMKTLLAPMLILAALGCFAGWLWTRRAAPNASSITTDVRAKNPLEISSALLFASLFVVMMILAHYALTYLGRGGVYGLALLSGFTDITPLILSLTEMTAAATPLLLAATAILIAAASNNMIKAFYAYGFSDRTTGRESLTLLLGFAVLGFLPIFFLHA